MNSEIVIYVVGVVLTLLIAGYAIGYSFYKLLVKEN